MTAKTNSLSDADHLIQIKGYHDRLRSAFEGIQKHFVGDVGTLNTFQKYAPNVKRTDHDEGSLPFFTKDRFAKRPVKMICLFTLCSYIVNLFWRIRDERKFESEEEFVACLEIFEDIVKRGPDQYKVAGKMPKFSLVDKDYEIDQGVQPENSKRDTTTPIVRVNVPAKFARKFYDCFKNLESSTYILQLLAMIKEQLGIEDEPEKSAETQTEGKKISTEAAKTDAGESDADSTDAPNVPVPPRKRDLPDPPRRRK